MRGLLTNLMVSFALVCSAAADTPQLINYQGRLTAPSGTPVVNGTYSVNFTLYDAPVGGVPQWGETQSVTTSDGLFTVQLGSVIFFGNSLFNDSSLWLAIKVGADPELSPRTRLTSVPYALNAQSAAGWEKFGSSVRLQTNTDYVGIGTSSPTRPFHVTEPSGGLFVSRFESSHPNAAVNEFANSSSSANWELAIAGSAGAFGGWVTPGDMYFYKQGNSVPSIICNPNGHVAIGVPSQHGRLDVGDAFDTIGGYFAVSANTYSTHVIHSEYTGVGNFDATAVYGKSVPADFYGIGGMFEGGYIGVRGIVTQNGSGLYKGVEGSVAGDGTGEKIGVRGNAYGAGGLKYGVYATATSGNTPDFGYAIFARTDGPSGTGARIEVDGWNASAVSADATGFGNVTGLWTSAHGLSTNLGIYAEAYGGSANYAGYFYGNAYVTGTLWKGAGAFRIDHPLDPEHKYLQHSFVESSDMMNIYNGNVTTDASGYANITLPVWFDALNKDFRYQLTVVGQFAQAMIAQEILNNQFVIQTDKPSVKVSWQVTGIRKDAYAQAHPIEVELAKRAEERGKYAHPELYGKGREMGIWYQPEADKSVAHPSSHNLDKGKMK